MSGRLHSGLTTRAGQGRARSGRGRAPSACCWSRVPRLRGQRGSGSILAAPAPRRVPAALRGARRLRLV